MKSARFKEHGFFLIGAVTFVAFVLLSLFAPLITGYDPYKSVVEPFAEPSTTHWLGGNDMGQDILSELLYGGRISLSIGILAAVLSTVTALILALIAGYKAGSIDRLIMRLVDIVMCLPYLPFVIVLGAFIGAGMSVQVFVIALVMWAEPCRELRSLVLKCKSNEYVEASRAMGASALFVIKNHLLSDLLPLVIPQFVRIAQRAILLESSLSFLGLGDPILKSWGSILYFANNRTAFLTGAWINWVLPPGLCITLICLSLAFMGFSLKGAKGLAYHPWGSFLRPPKKSQEGKEQPVTEEKGIAIQDLNVTYLRSGEQVHALKNICFHIHPGSCTGIVGESGCGKSTLAMSIMGLLKFPAQVEEGKILYGKRDLLSLDQKGAASFRGREIAYIPQNSMNALNPIRSIQSQLMETIMLQRKFPAAAAQEEAVRLLELVGIPADRAQSYSYQLSGGMRQRVVIALALANNPSVLIADEATTGLDVLIEHGIIDLLLELKQSLNLALFFITHDLPLIASIADHLAVIHQGELVEEGPTKELCTAPKHPYTKKLIDNFPRLHAEKMWPTEKGEFDRTDRTKAEAAGTEPLLEAAGLSKTFHSRRFFQAKPLVRALDEVSFTLYPKEVLGIIGGSGSGKSTLARIIMGLHEPDTGSIRFRGRELTTMPASERRKLLTRKCHYVFQDPYQSLHPQKQIEAIVGEPLLIQGLQSKNIRPRVEKVLQDLGLPWNRKFLASTPAELSGGQRQRLAFARSVIAEPELIIADEPTSMLDVTLRMDLLRLMEQLRTRYQTTYIFITHDLALAHHFCDSLLVLKQGVLVEHDQASSIVRHPAHPYTRALLEAVRHPDFIDAA